MKLCAIITTEHDIYELPHESPKDFRLKILAPHGIFAAGGAFVPTQEKKKKNLANWQIGKYYESAQTP